jgi:probable HAF family extracellular repeat protein
MITFVNNRRIIAGGHTSFISRRHQMRSVAAVTIGITMLLTALTTGHTTNYTYTDLDYPDPGAVMTNPTAVNSTGTVVGSYYLAADNSTHGFIWHEGTFTTVDYAGSDYTALKGINDAGTIVGVYENTNGSYKGFSLSKDGTYTLIDCPSPDPDYSVTYTAAINNEDTIVGYCGTNGYQGFSLSGGTFTFINHPDETYGTYLHGINDAGVIVGYYRTSNQWPAFSFIDGNYAIIVYPGSFSTKFAYGINNEGTIVGQYEDTGGWIHGFLFSNETYTSFYYPGSYANTTGLNGINTAGLLVGWYYGTDSKNHAFLATPVLTLCELTVTNKGKKGGQGTVTSVPTGIDCGTTCKHQFECGTQVTLTADPSTGSTFTGWSGAGCTGTGTCVFTITKATKVKAAFTGPVALTVTNKGKKGGQGTVTSGDGNVNCGSTCKVSYPLNTQVTLTADPSPGSTFTGWSGAGCSGTSTCVVTMSKAQKAKATFAAGS